MIDSQKVPNLIECETSDSDPDSSNDFTRKLSPRRHLLIHYFSTVEQSSLQKHHEKSPKERLQHIQNFLNRLGATELFIHLIRFTSSDRVFEQTLNLATTILDGGNIEIQTQLLKLLKQDSKDSEKFFAVIRERMDQAQQDLKNGSSVSTDDLLGRFFNEKIF
jgi:hypothetical protein